MMRLAIVSDAHLHAPGSRRQREFVSFVDTLDVDRLVLLGDIFHAWGGVGDTPPDAVSSACAALRRRREGGLPITFVPGNHELRPGTYLEDRLGLEVRGVHVERAVGRGLVLAHGDEGDDRAAYRATRTLLRSRGFAWALDQLGPRRAQRLLDRLAGAAAAEDGRDPALVRRQRAWATARMSSEAHVVVMGHSHIAGLLPTAGGLVVHTGAWAGLRTWVAVSEARISLMRWTGAGRSAVLDARPWPAG